MGAFLTRIFPVIVLQRVFGVFLILAAANIAYKTMPIASGAHEARLLVAQLLAPSSNAAPIAASAPCWIGEEKTETAVALAAAYGPRREFLTIAALAPLTPSGLFFLGASRNGAANMAAPPGVEASSARIEPMPVPERAKRTSPPPARHKVRPARKRPPRRAAIDVRRRKPVAVIDCRSRGATAKKPLPPECAGPWLHRPPAAPSVQPPFDPFGLRAH